MITAVVVTYVDVEQPYAMTREIVYRPDLIKKHGVSLGRVMRFYPMTREQAATFGALMMDWEKAAKI